MSPPVSFRLPAPVCPRLAAVCGIQRRPFRLQGCGWAVGDLSVGTGRPGRWSLITRALRSCDQIALRSFVMRRARPALRRPSTEKRRRPDGIGGPASALLARPLTARSERPLVLLRRRARASGPAARRRGSRSALPARPAAAASAAVAQHRPARVGDEGGGGRVCRELRREVQASAGCETSWRQTLDELVAL